ncbi:phosphatase PAP2 family protein [Pendulispora brunnea]|uniref:Phosphatase PAP2 family protein n=1 Tax=Pendulispora brunnea TaxID=2905690 RepID=A0ABZ2K607_9BACT
MRSSFAPLRIVLISALPFGFVSLACSSDGSAVPQTIPVPAPPADPGFTDSAPVPAVPAYVDRYKSNVAANATEDTNATLGLLANFDALWMRGATWDGGHPTETGRATLEANIHYVVNATQGRTSNQADDAYFDDRRNQSYSIIDGLGPLASRYYSGAGATTTITAIPADATTVRYDDLGTGAGDAASALGKVVGLVNLLRGNYSSTTPTKNYFLYPRPFRQSADVVVVPTLVPAESSTPATDSGFTSGHTNAAYLAAFAMAYAIPERFQELLTRASELGHHRIVAGMHSPLDVIGGRMAATAIAASVLADSDNAAAKRAAYEQVHAYFEEGQPATSLYEQAHAGPPSMDRFASERDNRAAYRERMTYGFAPPNAAAMTPSVPSVPKAAEVLLETRFPYLDAEQRRVVLRTTALESGLPVLDDPEGWGRLDVVAAADGYGQFAGNVVVTMDSSRGGFHAVDRWNHDISGPGKLTKRGTGTLILTGQNGYAGGTQLEGGTLEGDSNTAFGAGAVYVGGGTLIDHAPGTLTMAGDYTQLAAGTLTVDLGTGGAGRVAVLGRATFVGGTLHVRFRSEYKPAVGDTLEVLSCSRCAGKFDTIAVDGFAVTPQYSEGGVKLHIERAPSQ